MVVNKCPLMLLFAVNFPMNTLYYGDNLKILREYIKDESVDLIYLDPPFNSNRNYNLLFKDESGSEAESQITAFEDTWHWNHSAEQTFHELINPPDQVGRMIESVRQFTRQERLGRKACSNIAVPILDLVLESSGERNLFG